MTAVLTCKTAATHRRDKDTGRILLLLIFSQALMTLLITRQGCWMSDHRSVPCTGLCMVP
jgi:hypothetical protein